MKKLMAGIFIGTLILGTSCKKYLDINNNPNQATSATPELILPQALTYTARVLNSYNSYGAETGMYSANAGGYGGFGESITYNYTTSGTGNWALTYDNLEDYQAILNKTEGQDVYDYFNGVARIMKAYEFQLLVDAFNDVPYTDAVKGADNLNPTYSAAKDIYKDLAIQLDTAIAKINAGANVPGVTPLAGADVVFAGNMTQWKRLANTLKLRILIRGAGKIDFANKTFSSDGFLTTDALINPGYTRDNGKQNPAWDTWAYGYTGSAANKAWMPSEFIFGFYDGHSLYDSARGRAIYYKFPATGINQLGVESNSLISSPTGSFWYSGTDRDGKSNGNQIGILKGPDAGFPVMLASESYFLQAEGNLGGLLSNGSWTQFFNSGVDAAFNYTYQLPDGSVAVNVVDTVAAYRLNNQYNYLVNAELATTPAQKLEAIITQKFIALNYIESQEAWNEYRRTHYPAIVTGGSGYKTFASSVSESPRPDKLPTRILYPVSEGTYNGANVPKDISPFNSLIFWAL
jgi:Starch-binding associating with outer membrane/Susd and RagB outer membrane lipoprotein